MIKITLALIGAVLVTMLINYCIAIILTQLGVPGFIVMVVALILGFTFPGKIMTWIYKEEIEESKSEKQKEE